MPRFFTSILIFISVLFMPFWVPICLAVAGMIIFHVFIEGVLLLFVADLLYAVGTERFHNWAFIYLISFSILLAVVESLKVKMKLSGADGSMGKLYTKL